VQSFLRFCEKVPQAPQTVLHPKKGKCIAPLIAHPQINYFSMLHHVNYLETVSTISALKDEEC
jgi:hypothetical protein